LAVPEIVWRLVKPLVPLKELVFALREQLHDPANPRREDIPFMEETLDFVGPDRQSTRADSDWPFWG